MLEGTNLSSKNIDHLGLVAGMCKELGIAEIIDKAIPNPQKGKIVSYGKLVEAMILNGLGFTSKALYLTPHFFEDKAICKLLGDNINGEQLNDDALGRTLDKIFSYGVNGLYSQISANIAKKLGLDSKIGHLDSTSFSVSGNNYSSAYNNTNCINITKGYSKDHRPDLNQCVLNLIIENQASLPILMQEANGNANDKTEFLNIIKSHIEQLKNDHNIEYIIADSALYTEKTISELDSKIKFITRVPENLKATKIAIKAASSSKLIKINDNYSYYETTSEYGGVLQRWLVLYSAANKQQKLKTLNNKLLKLTLQEQKDFKKLKSITFSCETDANNHLINIKKNFWVSDFSNIEVTKIINKKQELYKLTGDISSNISAKKDLSKYLGYFVLATNELDAEELSNEDILLEYKGQNKVERGFRFLKSPQFLTDSFYVKKPERLTSILMIMTLCLAVYSSLEYKIKIGLLLIGSYFIDQKGKDTQRPTAKWVFEYFSGIHLLIIDSSKKIILNLKERQKIILKALGNIYLEIYDCTDF